MKAPQPTFAPCGAFATGVRRAARRGIVSVLLVALITPVLAQNGGDSADSGRALGLRPPSAAERAWMEREMRITERVWPNKLAIERLNRERQVKGLRSVNVPVVPNGEEVGTSSPGNQAGEDSLWLLSSPEVATSGGTVGLAASVDNSTLPSFPPVRDQGQIGSCASFSTGYYVGTHMLGLARGLNTTSASDNSNKLSPKWLYALVNDGQDGGSWFTSNLDVLLKLGAPSWQLYPYVGSPSPASNFREWSRDPAVWRAAIFNRFREAGRITGVDTQAGLNSLKALLANGYIVLYATDIFGWQFTTFANDPATTADNALAGREVCWKVNVNNSGHAMTIVGYNDDVWTDINRNGVVDAGEKGALKIVNSWGTRWKDGGFSWIAYDALRATSAVSGADNSGRAISSWRRAFWYNEVYWIAARASYTPALLAEFTLSHARRSDLELRVGSSPTTTSTPQSLFPVAGGFDGWSNASDFGLVFRRLGGGFAFDGGSTALSGTFVFDLTDVLRQGAARYYLVATDSAAGSPCIVTAFKLTSSAGQTLASLNGLNATVDAGTRNFSVDFNSQSSSAPVITSASAASATVGQPFSFQISASNSPNSYSAAGLPPGLACNGSTGAITGTPTQPGTFDATVSASNSAGSGSAPLTITVATRVPQITSAPTAAGTVGQAFSYQIAASEAPTRYAAAPLPPGMAVNPDTGLVSGTPSQVGTFEMIVSAANAAGTGNRKVTVTIAPPIAAVPVITSAENIGGTSGSAFSYRIEASNSPTSFGADNLPGTLSINGATGQISGTLPSARIYYITLRASNAAGTGYRTLVLNVTGEAIVGPPNDALANAIVLTGANPPQAEGNNRQATQEDGEPPHAGHTSHSVWWVWTAPRSGVVTISTEGSTFDTVLAAYTGVSLPALIKVAENDDSGGVTTSRVEFTATAGTAYKIAVDGYGSAVGDIKLRVQQETASAPANDMFADRGDPLTATNFTLKASNAGATPENGEPTHAGFPAAKSVWWSWTAPSNGRVTLDTKGSAFDTLLAIYTGASVVQLVPVASDDQSGGNNTSLAVFTAVQGITYQFAVDGCRGEEGGITLNLLLEQITGPVNDNFSSAHNLTGNSGSDIKSSANATAQAGEPAHAGSGPARSIWWKWTAPSSGMVRFDTDDSNFDTVLGVYTGNSVAALTRVASDDDSGKGNASKVEFPAVQGTTYYVAVDGFAGVAGDVKLNFAFAGASGNDNFVSAALIEGASATVSGSNANATSQAGEPAHAGSPAARSLWWEWTPSRSASAVISTAGSTFDTVLAIYTGGQVAALNPVVSNDDSGWSSTSQVAFFANAGTTYYLAVDGFGGASGRIQLALDQAEEGVLYETDFEDFSLGIDAMQGVDGWIVGDAESGSCGIFKPDGTTKAAWLGYNAPLKNAAYISRPVDFRPGANDEGIVIFSADVEVVDSTDANRDFFAFGLYNMSNEALGSIIFDNETGEVLIYEEWRPQGERVALTGVVFDTLDPRELKITYDLKHARWSASWGEAVLFQDRTLGAPGADLSVGSVDVVWYPANQASPGDNFLILDNYSLTTRALQAPVITNGAGGASAVRGQNFSYQITANNNPTSFAAAGLPDGLSIDSSTGLITGAPQVAGPYSILLSAANSAGVGTKTFLLSVVAPPEPPTVTSATFAAGKSAQPIFYQITADNAPTSFDAAGLPEGLTIDTSTGLISGSVVHPGNYVFLISASNAVGSGSAMLALTVSGDAPPELAPVITSALSASGQVGNEFSYLVLASNSPTSFSASNLPPGLTIDFSNGLITGVPAVPGLYTVSVGAVNADGVGSAPLVIDVADRPIVSPPPSYSSPKQPKKKLKPKAKSKPKAKAKPKKGKKKVEVVGQR